MLTLDRRDVRPLLIVVIAAGAMMAGRFAALTPDSHEYLALTAYFEGAVQTPIAAPFAYRVGIPWLVALLDFGPNTVEFAGISAIMTLAGHGLVYLVARDMSGRRDAAFLGALVCALSPVVFTYGARILTDGAAFCLTNLAVWLILRQRRLVFFGVVTASMLIREAVVVVLVSFALVQLAETWRTRRLAPLSWLLGAVAPVAVAVAIRGAFDHISPHAWSPTWVLFVGNLTRPLTWSASFSAAVPFVIAAAVALFAGDRRPWRSLTDAHGIVIGAHLIAVSLLAMAALTSAFMSPRFFWPAYVVVAPLVGLGLQGTWLQRQAARLCGETDAIAPASVTS